MAVDEAVLTHHSKGLVPPTLRFYGWTPPAISIGYFQSMEDEINVVLCYDKGIDMIRRLTGGGAVLHDKELTYSIIIRDDLKKIPKPILDSYKFICKGITRGLSHLDIDSSFEPLNDISAGGKKISGNAQTRRMGCVLQHGTIILDVNVDKMFSILRIPDEKIKDKLIKNVKERVTSLKILCGAEVSFEDARNAMIKGFSSALDIELVKGRLTESELDLAEKLMEEKYSAHEWKFKR